MRKSEDCKICRLVRFYLLCAVPLIALLGLGALESTPEGDKTIWFARVELIDFLAIGSLIALCFMIGYRAYLEYWLPKKRVRAIDELLERTRKRNTK